MKLAPCEKAMMASTGASFAISRSRYSHASSIVGYQRRPASSIFDGAYSLRIASSPKNWRILSTCGLSSAHSRWPSTNISGSANSASFGASFIV